MIADLTLLADEKEVSVRFYADGGDRDEAERLLIEWARAVGYRRVWLSNRLEELEPEPEKLDTAHVRCPTCRVEWRDSSPEFWLTVRKNGAFPIWCAICGHELPQWVVGRPRARRRRREADRGSPGSWHAARSREKSGRQEG